MALSTLRLAQNTPLVIEPPPVMLVVDPKSFAMTARPMVAPVIDRPTPETTMWLEMRLRPWEPKVVMARGGRLPTRKLSVSIPPRFLNPEIHVPLVASPNQQGLKVEP